MRAMIPAAADPKTLDNRISGIVGWSILLQGGEIATKQRNNDDGGNKNEKRDRLLAVISKFKSRTQNRTLALGIPYEERSRAHMRKATRCLCRDNSLYESNKDVCIGFPFIVVLSLDQSSSSLRKAGTSPEAACWLRTRQRGELGDLAATCAPLKHRRRRLPQCFATLSG